jgi:hypothetical protein
VTRRILVVATAPDPSDELLEQLGAIAGEDVEVAVVAPASDVSLAQWLAGEEEAAVDEARRRALEAAAAEAVAARVVDARVGDPDPVTAVEDALQSFPADELLVVTRPKDSATWLERRALLGELERFGLPVTHLVDDDADRAAVVRHAATREVWVGPFARRLVVTLAVVAGILVAVGVSLYYGLR